jgi:putative oxidoreductase
MTEPRLILPFLGPIYRKLWPVTAPLIRVIAGGALAWHGYPILFGNTAGAARFFESIGFTNGLFWAYVVGSVEFVCGLFLALGFLTRVVAVPIIGFLVIAIET